MAGRPLSHGGRVGRPSPTYNAWAYIRRVSIPKEGDSDGGTPKGFHDPHWSDFRGFLEDMGECPSRHRLARHDTKHGFDAVNCYWQNPEQKDAAE